MCRRKYSILILSQCRKQCNGEWKKCSNIPNDNIEYYVFNVLEEILL